MSVMTMNGPVLALAEPDVDPSAQVHPTALCDGRVGARTRVWAFAHVLPGARVGADCNLCDHVFVEGGAVIGDGVTVKNGVCVWDGVRLADGVFVGPHATFTNDLFPRARSLGHVGPLAHTIVDRGAAIGANATIVCGIRIGEYALVGAGAVVTRDVPAHALVAGNPARVTGQVCRCGRRLEATPCPCGAPRPGRPA